MKKTLLVALGLITTAITNAENISLSGAVYDLSLNPLNGVEISLASAGFKDSSLVDGTWRISGATNTSIDLTSKCSKQAYINGSNLVINSKSESNAKVAIRSINGSVRSQNFVHLQIGTNSYKINANPEELASSIVSIEFENGQTAVVRNGLSQIIKNGSAAGARAQTEAIDTIVYKYKGWIRAKSPLGAYNASGIIQKLDLITPNPDSIIVANHNADSIAKLQVQKFVATYPNSKAYFDSAAKYLDKPISMKKNIDTIGTERSANPSFVSLSNLVTYTQSELKYGNYGNVDLIFVTDTTDSLPSIGSAYDLRPYSEFRCASKISETTMPVDSMTTNEIIKYAFSRGKMSAIAKPKKGTTYIVKIADGSYGIIRFSSITTQSAFDSDAIIEMHH